MNTEVSVGGFQYLNLVHKGQRITLRGYNPYLRQTKDTCWVLGWDIVRPDHSSVEQAVGTFKMSELELAKAIAADYFSWGTAE